MSVKYVVTTGYNEEKTYTVIETKNFEDALREFLEYAEEPYWHGDKVQVTLSFTGKGKKSNGA